MKPPSLTLTPSRSRSPGTHSISEEKSISVVTIEHDGAPRSGSVTNLNTQTHVPIHVHLLVERQLEH